MMNNKIKIIKKDFLKASDGRIIGTECVNITVLTTNCTYIQEVIEKPIHLNQEIGYENNKRFFRFDFFLNDINLCLDATMYVELFDDNGTLHQYKIIKVNSRTILGRCLLITLITENLTGRDTKEVLYKFNNVTI